MTMMTAACALIDDLVDSGSFLRTQVSACDYGILDQMPACAVTLRPGLSTFDSEGFGHFFADHWGWSVEGWVQDSGDVEQTLKSIITMHDSLRGAIVAGSITNTNTRAAHVTSITHNPQSVWNFGGPDYFLVTATVQVSE
jgi:hypothetical protein